MGDAPVTLVCSTCRPEWQSFAEARWCDHESSKFVADRPSRVWHMIDKSHDQEYARNHGSEESEMVFVVRVRQPTAASATEVHGRAEHLQSRRSCYFKNCTALCEFMIQNVRRR